LLWRRLPKRLEAWWHWLGTPIWKVAEKDGTKESSVSKSGEELRISVGRRKAEVSVSGSGGSGGSGGSDTKDGKADDGNGGDGLGAVVLKAAGAIAAGIGATGAVVAVGAAVLWIRFHQAGLPAIQAISVQPKYEPLVQGAETTITFMLIALAAVTVIFFADAKGHMNRITLAAVLALAATATAYAASTDLTALSTLLLAALALILAVASVEVGRRTGDLFWPFAIAVFLAALVFSSATGMLIAKQQQFVQGAAVLRSAGDAGLTGIYIAASDEKIYLGVRAPTASANGEINGGRGMFDVDRSEGVTYAVGPLESREDAEKRAQVLLARLREDRRLDPAPAEREDSADTAGNGGSADSSKSSGDGGSSGEATLRAPPSEVDSRVLEAFAEPPTVHDEVDGRRLCLARYSELGSGQVAGHWWTECDEFDNGTTMLERKERLALPARFQAVYDVRTEIELRGGSRLYYLKGTAAEQCEHDAAPGCGHRYEGGGTQFYLLNPAAALALSVARPKVSCTTARQDRPPAWQSCAS
jgi:hypothetical protein